MKCLAITLVYLLASCSPSETPSVAQPPAPKPAPAPATPPAPAPATAESAAQEIMELPGKKAATPASSRDLEPHPTAKRTREPAPPGVVYLPSFTIRTLRGSGARVLINGADYDATPCLWSVHEAMEFDQAIPVREWPPADAVFVGRSQVPEQPSFQAEVYLKKSPTNPDEYVLYIKGRAGSTNLLGALRLEVVGNQYAIYTPLVDPEGELASKYLRTLWFEGKP